MTDKPISDEAQARLVASMQAQAKESKLSAAWQAERDAAEAMRLALRKHAAAVAERLRCELAIQDKTDNAAHLAAIIGSNSARWSGGPYSPENITEAHTQAAAIELLRRATRT